MNLILKVHSSVSLFILCGDFPELKPVHPQIVYTADCAEALAETTEDTWVSNLLLLTGLIQKMNILKMFIAFICAWRILMIEKTQTDLTFCLFIVVKIVGKNIGIKKEKMCKSALHVITRPYEEMKQCAWTQGGEGRFVVHSPVNLI